MCLRHSTGSSLNPPCSTLKSRSGQRPFAHLGCKLYWGEFCYSFCCFDNRQVHIEIYSVTDLPGSPLHTISKATAALKFHSSLSSSLQHIYLKQKKDPYKFILTLFHQTHTMYAQLWTLSYTTTLLNMQICLGNVRCRAAALQILMFLW